MADDIQALMDALSKVSASNVGTSGSKGLGGGGGLTDDSIKSNNLSFDTSFDLTADDAELDLKLQQDPCCVSYGDRISIRSSVGFYLNGDSEDPLDGNPAHHGSEFVFVGTAIRRRSGIVKHGDTVAIMHRQSGAYIGVSDKDRDSLQIRFVKKSISKREQWTIVEVEQNTPDRLWERDQRIAASNARLGARAKQLGIELKDHQITPRNREIQLCLRSSDGICLQSNFAQSKYLSFENNTLVLRSSKTPTTLWNVMKVPAPFIPTWARARPHLTGFVCKEEKAVENPVDIIRELSRPDMEERIVECVLYAFQGVETEVLKCVDGYNWFVAEDQISDPALYQLTHRILPLCSHVSKATQYVIRRSRTEYGRVSQALAAAMRTLLRQFQVLVAQLEYQKDHQQLSFQKLWFYVQPSLRSMEILGRIHNETESYTGGALLNSLLRLSSKSGDEKTKNVFHFLIQHATVPYLEMLELWIYHGVIRDPYNEFMICVDEEASKKTLRDDFNARYWDARYTLRQRKDDRWLTLSAEPVHDTSTSDIPNHGAAGHIPIFLQRIAEKILTTGKYLNVVRECGRWVDNEFGGKIPFSSESHAYEQIVERAHDFASRILLNLLLQEEKLVARLRSIKHYFLLDQGDFFVHFMDIAAEELKMPVKEIAVPRLQSLLEMCLRIRNVNDPYQEDLACELVPYTLTQHVEAIHEFSGAASSHLKSMENIQESMNGLHGVDAFTLDFKVRWPLSLVLSRQALTKYQLIFRHLFFCKHVERELCTTWLAHQTTKELNLRSALGPDYCLRQRMLHFLQNFEYYVMFEVLEPRWHELEQRLEQVKTVDELMKHHSEFLDTCLRECLLTNQALLKTLAKIMTTCLLFADQIRRFTDQLQVDEESIKAALGKNGNNSNKEADFRMLRKARVKVQEAHMRGIVTQESYRQTILRSQHTFDSMLSQFMDDLINEATHGEYHSHLTNLCTRLDFNSYYRK